LLGGSGAIAERKILRGRLETTDVVYRLEPAGAVFQTFQAGRLEQSPATAPAMDDARPQSVTARIALATAYPDYGWHARGEGEVETVSDSGWKLLEEPSDKAAEVLKQAWSLLTKCPE